MLTEPPVELLNWARAALTAAGYRPTDTEPQIRRRDWSTVIRIDTDRGAVWAKANSRGFAIEAGLLELLARHTPNQVLHPIAVDVARARFVTPDGGRVLEESGPASEDDWIELLSDFADLQITMAGHLDELTRLGLPDVTPPTLTNWFRQVLDRVAAEPVVRGLFPDAELAALAELIPVTEVLAAELGAGALPMSVDHNDLHTDNVFAGTPTTPGLRIFDWGDAIVTHPFLCLGRALRVAVEDEDGEPDATSTIDVDRLRDCYLRRWLPAGETAIPASFRRTAELAETLSDVALAASWLRIDVGRDAEWAGWFATFIRRYAINAARLFSQRTPQRPA